MSSRSEPSHVSFLVLRQGRGCMIVTPPEHSPDQRYLCSCNGVWHMLQASQQDAVCPAARFYANTAQSSGKAGNQSEAQTDRPLNPHDQRLGEFADTMLVDTLALMKSFESSGLDREQAEAITRHVTQLILSQSSHNLSLFTTKSEMQRVIVTLDSKQQQHKQEMQVLHVSITLCMSIFIAERIAWALPSARSCL